MSRLRVTLAAVLAGTALLTSCSSGGDAADSDHGTRQADKPAAAPAAEPITREISQAHLTQALLGDGENLPGYSLHGDKDVTDGRYCNAAEDADTAPRGWVRGGDSSYEHNGSTVEMAYIAICLFDSTDAAHRQYTTWKGDGTRKQVTPKKPLGDENTLVAVGDDSFYGYLRSGRATVRVRVEGGAAGDPSGAQTMLAATLKRLQQLQDGQPATATAADEQAGARQ
ncbi:hypothetical protein GTW43_13525 [Streptomyces sp. SID5785]|uniref:hypothetical protein n=1 Tax=Streptomyces sp. SID5785 TaxID=2690309 RepID=UPI0013618B7E|nr:hypothetical protein [Streptomyces sp. SID5785]MZD06103.1 hypothetical protein [Streptomyces sp. SID5785]